MLRVTNMLVGGSLSFSRCSWFVLGTVIVERRLSSTELAAASYYVRAFLPWLELITPSTLRQKDEGPSQAGERLRSGIGGPAHLGPHRAHRAVPGTASL